jgi:Spy/CpxP family protein refolding chaperone
MMNAQGSPRRIRVLAILALVVVFAAGMAAGVATMRMLAGRAAEEADSAPGLPVLAPGARILDGLNLTERQRAAIDTIVARHRAEAAQIWRDVQPRFLAIAASARAEIRAVLTDEQNREFDRRLARRRQALRSWVDASLDADTLGH